MKRTFIAFLLVTGLFSCNKEEIKPISTDCNQSCKYTYIEVWQKKSSCTLDSLNDNIIWETYATTNEVKTNSLLDTSHYFYMPSHITGYFERFRYKRIN